MKYTKVLFFSVFALFLCNCKKENTSSNLKCTINYKMDSLLFVPNKTVFTHPAGYLFGVTRLQYYISRFTAVKENGDLYIDNGFHYIDALIPENNTLVLSNLPQGKYKEITFAVGLDSLLNQTDKLPTTVENLNMAWPILMGGGYHFVKMEGVYEDATGNHGYAVHIGRNENVIRIRIPNTGIQIEPGENRISLSMNITEWFKNPVIYDFNVDGNYTMGNPVAMSKIKKNAEDIFTK